MAGCSFSGCDKLAAAGGMCPRHSFLVSQMGAEKAEVVENGIPCSVCGTRFFDSEDLLNCKNCRRREVCSECRAGECCCFVEDFDGDEADDDEADDDEVGA
ncbi:MAG TPA: hypothetical protein VHB45_13055 [Alloacidobacterium sp.]|nr:hypothetical protein [Alloacidobacterium sp.]